jgi:hypothetical protein
MSSLYEREVDLLAAVHAELHVVSETFTKGKDQHAPYHNMPLHSSRVLWCRCLADRIVAPMSSARRLLRDVSDTDGWEELSSKYDALILTLEEFQQEEVAKWLHSIDAGKIAEKLKQPLLVRDVSTKLLRLNFDPVVGALLRETKYFCMMDVQVGDVVMCASMCAGMYLYMCMHKYIHSLCMYVWMYVCMYVCIYIYVCMFIYI